MQTALRQNLSFFIGSFGVGCFGVSVVALRCLAVVPHDRGLVDGIGEFREIDTGDGFPYGFGYDLCALLNACLLFVAELLEPRLNLYEDEARPNEHGEVRAFKGMPYDEDEVAHEAHHQRAVIANHLDGTLSGFEALYFTSCDEAFADTEDEVNDDGER